MNKRRKTRVHIGCSGWNYAHWKSVFYPAGSSSSSWLGEYSSVFSTVEINNTFYRLPSLSTFRKWRDDAPKGFIYSVKAGRFITHMKKLKNAGQPLARFLRSARTLAGHLGPILFQLPPRWNKDTERLSSFTAILPGDFKYVFEFRDNSWYDKSVYDILHKSGAALCLHDMKGSESPVLQPAGSFCYIRFHGSGSLYGGRYPSAAIRRWAGFIKKVLSEGRDVYAYFNNDAQANAPKDALRLIKAVS